MDRRVDIAISAIFMALGLFVIIHATSIKSGMFTDPIGPRAFFYFCGVVFILGGAINLLQRYSNRSAAVGHLVPSEGVDDEEGYPASFKRALTIALLSMVYILTFRPVGYLIGTPIYLLAALWVLEQRNWGFNIAVAVVFTTVFYLTFAQGLGVWLPVGPFTSFFREMGWIIL